MLTRLEPPQRTQDSDEKPTLLQRALHAFRAKLREARDRYRERRAEAWCKRNVRFARSDAGSLDIIDVVIGIAIFAAVIGLIVTQLQNAADNMTGSFAVGKALLYIVPLLLIAVLIKRVWSGNGSGGGHSRRGRF